MSLLSLRIEGRRRRGTRARFGTLRLLGTGLLLITVGCDARPERGGFVQQVPDGDPKLAPAAIRRYGCIDCHIIPGIRGVNALVGPPLIHWSNRVYIAGLLPNTPDNLVAWILSPQRIHPGSAMPDMGVSLEDARHIAAYLYTIR